MGAGTKVHNPGRLTCLSLLLLFLCFWPCVHPASAQDHKTYVSQKHGFSFQYPAAYELKGTGDYLDFLEGGKLVFSLWVDDRFIEMLYQMLYPGPVVYRIGEDPYKELARKTRGNPELFRRYARSVARNWCSADGPDGSVYCEEIKNEKTFVSRGGLNCLEFYPVVIQEDFANHTKQQGVVGPFFAAYLPKKDLPILAVVSPPHGRLASSALRQAMREIIDSLRPAP